MTPCLSASPSVWRHYPWLLGLLLAPLLFGSVNPEGQAVVGLLFAVSLVLLCQHAGGAGHYSPVCKPVWVWVALFVLMVPLVPLPIGIVEWLSPDRAALARSFPIEPGTTLHWISLTISPVATVRRLCEIGLIITAFRLARWAAARPESHRTFALVIGAALFLLAVSDIWFCFNGQREILGLWPNSAGHAAGTFANRNHFAGWIYVAALFIFGWILQHRLALQTRRAAAVAPFLIAGATLLSLVMAVKTGSRGGFVAFLVGLAIWVASTLFRPRIATMNLSLIRRSPRRVLWLGATALVSFLVLLAASDYLLGRLPDATHDLSFKTSIWRDSLAILGKFPLFGTGSGTFETAFNHFKSFGGKQTFLHAENDLVQLFVEHGLVGGVVLLAVLFQLLRAAVQFALRGPRGQSLLVCGALAGLAAFAAHSLFEFVLQITANALLAASLLGFAIGCRDRVPRPIVPAPPSRARISLNLGWSVALVAVCVAQGAAFLHWQRARSATPDFAALEQMHRSLSLWPWNSERHLALARAQVRLLNPRAGFPDAQQQQAAAEQIHDELSKALARDPFNWALRWERTGIDLAFSTNAPRVTAEAWEVTRLNPLQPQIPLRLARHFAARDPEQALAFLRAAPLTSDEDFREALELSWSIERNPSSLWGLVPATPAGLKALGDFAAAQKLSPLAAQAYARFAAVPK